VRCFSSSPRTSRSGLPARLHLLQRASLVTHSVSLSSRLRDGRLRLFPFLRKISEVGQVVLPPRYQAPELYHSVHLSAHSPKSSRAFYRRFPPLSAACISIRACAILPTPKAEKEAFEISRYCVISSVNATCNRSLCPCMRQDRRRQQRYFVYPHLFLPRPSTCNSLCSAARLSTPIHAGLGK
jgi:hypothetical protein